MEIVTILWSFCAAVAIVLAAVFGMLWLIERRDLLSFVLCVVGLAVAISLFAQQGLMHSATAAEYGEWARWNHASAFVVLTGQLLFVAYYLGTGRSWLMWLIICMRSVILVINFSVNPNFNFSSMISLKHVSLFGEQVSVIGVAVLRVQLQWFAVASLVLFTVYLIDAAARKWQDGGKDARHKALAVALGLAVPASITFLYGQLVLFGVLSGPLGMLPWYLGTLLIMSYELGREMVLNRRERLAAAELRSQLAQTERVTLMGQLASALSHELSQPLAATILNVEAAQTYVKRGDLNPTELQSILDDIRGSHLRAAAIIDRMRQLFKKRTIEVQAVRLEDILHDVLTLIRSETISKHVALRLVVQPGLPRVSGDRVHLTQVLLNLLMNSVQAMQSLPCDARHIVVEARSDDAKREVEVAVQDTGPGIPSGVVDQLFEPFFTTKTEGTGVGLALSRRIIEVHGGRLWYDSTTKQSGAIFRFTLRQDQSSETSIGTDRSPALTSEVLAPGAAA